MIDSFSPLLRLSHTTCRTPSFVRAKPTSSMLRPLLSVTRVQTPGGPALETTEEATAAINAAMMTSVMRIMFPP
jgi:hypothetical protein